MDPTLCVPMDPNLTMQQKHGLMQLHNLLCSNAPVQGGFLSIQEIASHVLCMLGIFY